MAFMRGASISPGPTTMASSADGNQEEGSRRSEQGDDTLALALVREALAHVGQGAEPTGSSSSTAGIGQDEVRVRGRRSNLPRVSFVSQGESASVALAFANLLNVNRLLGVDTETDNVGSEPVSVS